MASERRSGRARATSLRKEDAVGRASALVVVVSLAEGVDAEAEVEKKGKEESEGRARRLERSGTRRLGAAVDFGSLEASLLDVEEECARWTRWTLERTRTWRGCSTRGLAAKTKDLPLRTPPTTGERPVGVVPSPRASRVDPHRKSQARTRTASLACILVDEHNACRRRRRRMSSYSRPQGRPVRLSLVLRKNSVVSVGHDCCCLCVCLTRTC